MKPEDIKDEASLKAWLDTQPREVAITIAHRAAMRVAPLFWRRVRPAGDAIDLPAIVVSRAGLLSEGAAINPTPQTTNAASSACSAASMAAAIFAQTPFHTGNEDEAGYYPASEHNAGIDAAHAFAGSSYATTTGSADVTAAAVGAIGSALSSAATADAANADATLPTVAARAALWKMIGQDIAALVGLANVLTAFKMPLWPRAENPLADSWAQIRTAWVAETKKHPGWQFWIDWYDAALEGRPLLGDWDRHWALLTDIALIDPEVWDKGPDAVNPAVASIFERHRDQVDNVEPTPAEEVASAVASAPSSSKTEVVRRAMETNRDAIPHSLDALEAFLLLEIERLQQSNHLNAVAPDECARMIRNLVTMYEVIRSLRARLPETRPVSDSEAQESEALIRLYWDKLRELPRDKADGVVEAVWQTGAGIVQGGLILGSSTLAVAYGLPALVSVATGALLFAPDKAAAIINAARGSFPKS